MTRPRTSASPPTASRTTVPAQDADGAGAAAGAGYASSLCADVLAHPRRLRPRRPCRGRAVGGGRTAGGLARPGRSLRLLQLAVLGSARLLPGARPPLAHLPAVLRAVPHRPGALPAAAVAGEPPPVPAATGPAPRLVAGAASGSRPPVRGMRRPAGAGGMHHQRLRWLVAPGRNSG